MVRILSMAAAVRVAGTIAVAMAAIIVVAIAMGCGPASGDARGEQMLVVFAAASLGEPFRELGAAFEADSPGIRVEFNFAGSQTLRTQLEHGASADVFAAADWRQMAAVKEAGLLGSAPEYFAANRMSVVAPASSGAVQSLRDLAHPGVRIAIAAAEVPAGSYARQALGLLAGDGEYPDDFAEAVLSNVATNETSVRGVAQKVALGEVDAGIVYQTDATADQYAGALRMIEIPLRFNPSAEYPIAALAHGGAGPETPLAFIRFVQSDAGRAILRERGFAPPANIACPCQESESDGG